MVKKNYFLVLLVVLSLLVFPTVVLASIPTDPDPEEPEGVTSLETKVWIEIFEDDCI